MTSSRASTCIVWLTSSTSVSLITSLARQTWARSSRIYPRLSISGCLISSNRTSSHRKSIMLWCRSMTTLKLFASKARSSERTMKVSASTATLVTTKCLEACKCESCPLIGCMYKAARSQNCSANSAHYRQNIRDLFYLTWCSMHFGAISSGKFSLHAFYPTYYTLAAPSYT